MTPPEKLAALLAESKTLIPPKDSARLCSIYAEAATLVDRKEKPKKWAAFRMMYGQAADQTDPQGALQAFREALPYWDPALDQAAWATCKFSIGWTMSLLGKISPPESEEVIECLEATIGDFPFASSLLATYYSARTLGDPLDNWKKQVHYLEFALGQVSPGGDPVQWATLKNTLAVALTREPDGDFAKAAETRILYHREALALLAPAATQAGSVAQDRWIKICVDTSDAYLSRVGTNPADDRKTAEQYAHAAWQACSPLTAKDTRVLATMGLARALLNEDAAGSKERWTRALALCGELDGLIDPISQPAIAATNQKFKALAHLKLMEMGEPGHLEDLVKAADSAYSLVHTLYPDLSRTVMQLAAEALFVVRDFIRATGYLQRAVEAGETLLQQATSRAGRLERIFDLQDSYARLAYCLFQAKDLGKGIEALDAGKGRLWRPAKLFATFEQMRALTPRGGALLFPTFAPKDGAVAIITERGGQVCQLPGFGRERLKELLLGDVQNPDSQSWISRYLFRNAYPDRWRAAIDAVGCVLFDILWSPLLPALKEVGIQDGAELVWFPQAGLGVAPLHAAWKQDGEKRRWICESYAIRYSPSASSLIENAARAAAAKERRVLLVSDPAGDLSKSELESEWVRQSQTPGSVTLLAGGAALKQTVMAELANATLAHFSTHAVFRIDDPFKSNLLMANGETLSLEELLPLMEKSPLTEVILSGCETAMAQVARRPDEFLGFPAAFLEHGAATVIATQWPVDDWAAAALVGRFYREWPGKTAAQAMRAAQNWMRDVTADELSELLRPLKSDPGPVGAIAAEQRTWLMGFDPEGRPFAHPFFWAGFTVSGN